MLCYLMLCYVMLCMYVFTFTFTFAFAFTCAYDIYIYINIDNSYVFFDYTLCIHHSFCTHPQCSAPGGDCTRDPWFPEAIARSQRGAQGEEATGWPWMNA
jgi:hypothetical protein